MGTRAWAQKILVVVAMLIGLTAALAPPANAQETPAVTEICNEGGLSAIPELGDGLCVAVESAAVLFASVCGQLLPAEICANVDGATIDSSVVDRYQDDWVHQALRLQSRYDAGEPMRNWLVPHTHNSSNSTANAVSVSNLDPNQRYSILDQLRMDIRGIELDLHLVGGQPVMCHGRTVDVGGYTVHVGCSVDRPLADGLAEIATFMAQPGNENEFVVLYLENQLDNDPAAHNAVASLLEQTFGDRVARPPAGMGDGTCAPAPMDTTRQAMLDQGKRVVIVGNCGPGAWGSWVFERGSVWAESSFDGSYDGYPACATGVRVERDYDGQWIRHWEDLTALSALVAGGDQFPLTPEVTAQMVACGVDMIGFDRLEPFDGRLEALVWSWARDVLPADIAGECASRHAVDGRWYMDDCEQVRPFTCRLPDGSWLTDAPRGKWADGEQACAARGAVWALPPTGWENNVLGVAQPADAWLPIGKVLAQQTPTPAVPGDLSANGTETLPVTGGSSSILLLVVALGSGGLFVRRRWLTTG